MIDGIGSKKVILILGSVFKFEVVNMGLCSVFTFHTTLELWGNVVFNFMCRSLSIEALEE